MNSNINIENFLKDFSCTCKIVQKNLLKKSNHNYIYTKRNQICILLNGSADLVRYDLNGDKSIIEHFTKNDIFGKPFILLLQTMNFL